MIKIKKKTKFSEPRLWNKINKVAHQVGAKVVYPVVLLYYLFKSKEVPIGAKTMIVGVLTYFIVPFDGLPDFIPFLGYTDDLSLLMATVSKMIKYVSPQILEQTRNKIGLWFKNKAESSELEEQLQKQMETAKLKET